MMNVLRTSLLSIALTGVLAACAPSAEKQAGSAPANTNANTPATTKEIKFATDAAYAPFESMAANGEIVGFDIDIAKAMCEEMKAKCTFQNQAWDGIIPGLTAKKYDVIASSMSITPEREQAVAFTQKIWDSSNQFAAKKGTITDVKPETLKNKTLGVQQGTVHDNYAAKYLKGVSTKRYKTLEDAYKDLTNGRVDIVFAEGVTVQEFLKTPSGQGFEKVGADVQSADAAEIFGRGTGFAVRKEDQALLADLNKAFDSIRANGTYKKIADKYFTFGIYGK